MYVIIQKIKKLNNYNDNNYCFILTDGNYVKKYFQTH